MFVCKIEGKIFSLDKNEGVSCDQEAAQLPQKVTTNDYSKIVVGAFLTLII